MSTQRESSKIPKHHASNVEVPAPQPVQMVTAAKLDQIPRPTIPAAPEPMIDPARFAGTQAREDSADLADARFDVTRDGQRSARSTDARVGHPSDSRFDQADGRTDKGQVPAAPANAPVTAPANATVDATDGGRLPARSANAPVTAPANAHAATRSTVIK